MPWEAALEKAKKKEKIKKKSIFPLPDYLPSSPLMKSSAVGQPWTHEL